MGNTRDHFERELKIMQNNRNKEEDGKLIIEDFIDNIRDIIEVFRKQGHSGGSAPYYASALSNTIKKTLMFEPLSPIMGTDDEWIEHDDCFQNNRCSALFKNNIKNPKNRKNRNNRNTKTSELPYYIDAIIWQGEDEYDTFTGTVEDVASWQYINGFPFTPKKFYINVKRELYDESKHGEDANYTSCGTGDYVYSIKNREELKEVEKYYNMLEQLKELNPQKYYKITRKQKITKINEK